LTSDVLAALRAATSERHARLDASLPLSGPAPTLDDYRAHLLMLRDWLRPIVSWLDGFDDGPRVPAARLAAIEADLSLMDGVPPPAPSAGWPPGASAAYRWGVCYVVEGSQLGGAVLYKNLAEALAPHPLGYLKGEGNPGPAWRAFIQQLGEQVRDLDAIADACSGACAAFDRLIKA
jgi:heme oxygenase